MRKSDPRSSRNNDRQSSFKRNAGDKPFSKDGRSQSKDIPPRSGERKMDRNKWDKSDDRKPRREFDKDRKPFKRDFDKTDRGEGGDRKPRREFDKDKKPFKRDFDKTDRGEGGDRKPRREFDKDKKPFKRDFDKTDRGESGDRKPRREFDKDKKPFKRDFDKTDRGESGDRKPRREFDKDKKPFKRDFDKADRGESSDRRPRREFDKDKKPFSREFRHTQDSDSSVGKPRTPKDSRPFRDRPENAERQKRHIIKKNDVETGAEKPVRKFDSVIKNAFNSPKKKSDPAEDFSKPVVHEDKVFGALEDPATETRMIPPRKNAQKQAERLIGKTEIKGRKKRRVEDEDEELNEKEGDSNEMPLNKYIAYSGECSRRDAAELVKQGKVKVNGELVLDPGYKVQLADNVTLVGKKLKPQKNNVYILLNKPRGYITTNEDPQGRKTVIELLQGVGTDRIFPVGRLDRDTSGLLLITNDGDLTQKLCHPSYNIKKVYQVTLDKPLTKADFEKIIEGVELEDGKAVVDEMAYLESKNEIGLEIHSGRNRIVRRIFESLGYVVDKLDRVMYAGLTKKNLPRGKWRHLDPREVILLKHFKS